MMRLSHLISSRNWTPKLLEQCARDCSAAGGKSLAVSQSMLKAALDDSEIQRTIARLPEHFGLRWLGMHSLWQGAWALNAVEATMRRTMLENQKKILRYGAELGVAVIVFHVGETIREGYSALELHDALRRTLDELLPLAEKLHVTIALENTIVLDDQPAALRRIFECFPSPRLGCCFDSGHANLFERQRGKTLAMMPEGVNEILFRGQLKFHHGKMLSALAPWVVTAHLHDNHGTADEHLMPGAGNIDWPRLWDGLKSCPRLEFVQSEVNQPYPETDFAELTRTFLRLSGGSGLELL